MIKNRTYIILFIILIVFLLVVFFLFGSKNMKRNYNPTLIVGEDTVWTYQNKKWSNVNLNKKEKETNWQKYEVYLDNEKFGSYYLWHDDKWYIFDNKKNAMNYEGSLVAFRAKYEINVLPFEEEEIDDEYYVDSVLEENGLNNGLEFSSYYKTHLDFDSDGVDEEFYVISNVFSDESESNIENTNVSIVFMVKDKKVYYVYKNINNKNSFDTCKPFINSFININNDKKYEVLISCGRYSDMKQLDMLYEFRKNNFDLLISNS